MFNEFWEYCGEQIEVDPTNFGMKIRKLTELIML